MRLVARQYYSTIGKAFRKYGKGQLIGGDAMKLREVPDEVFEELSPWVDFISIQVGDHQHSLEGDGRECPDETWFDKAEFDRIHKLTGKPILICDHQCGFYTSRTPSTGAWFQYASQQSAVDSYDDFLKLAFNQPYILGYFRCQFLTVWREDKNFFKQGLVDPEGNPFQQYIEGISKTNKEIHQLLK
ncbi:MAG: hypothetical protein NE330_07835 [Lentisphaeraceae bacterium]|nr:hypothetical protein [Lentisphaeraceae bacterium]